MTIDTHKLREDLDKSLGRAYSLGQTYWMQADSESYSQNRRADETQAKFDDMRSKAVEELSSAFDAQAAEIAALRAALETIAAYPHARDQEMGVTAMRKIARDALAQHQGEKHG